MTNNVTSPDESTPLITIHVSSQLQDDDNTNSWSLDNVFLESEFNVLFVIKVLQQTFRSYFN